MRQTKAGLLAVIFFIIFAATAQAAASTQSPIRVWLDQKEMKFQIAPVIKNGITFVQFKPLFQSLGYDVSWDAKTKQVAATAGGQKLQLTINSKTAYVNGGKNSLQEAPFITGGNTLVPLRFIAESTGYPVLWDAKARTIKIDRQSVVTKVTKEVNSFFVKFAAAENARDLTKTMQLIDPKSPDLEQDKEMYQMLYDKFQRHISFGSVTNVKVFGNTAIVTVDKTEKRSGGPFFWDSVQTYEITLKKSTAGSWKQYSYDLVDINYITDELIKGQPNVPENEKSAITKPLNDQYDGFNKGDLNIILSALDPDSPYRDFYKELADSGYFKDNKTHIIADSMKIVEYTGTDAVVYAEETDDSYGQADKYQSLYWVVKSSNGNWLIYDIIDGSQE
ncbi:copper amine oxidase N-terminal domain-containing protein [Paenibacillus sediminis]|uniref:Copper amine oxidase N-terminal domain-containing protein n=1 Tax=Paenibacillus sediminis TaxID=664909 RepID=A0ABS4H5P8_9BACL|nr:copper amine oxidase N-terminal domain-containing protein [Paenibacillus sediminis]MBP1937847.1 hypothetical protein [Paenibacillus sediminis]